MNTKLYQSNVRKRIRRIQRKILRISKHKPRQRLAHVYELYWAFYCGLRSVDAGSPEDNQAIREADDLLRGEACLRRDSFLHRAAARIVHRQEKSAVSSGWVELW